jgi:uncharacterized protein with PIN domain
MNVDELEDKIKKEKTDLATLEESYERETDENKQTKLEYKISRKEESINRLIDRQNVLLDRESNEGAKDNGKDKDEEEDKKEGDVCSECGGDLIFVTKDEKSGKDIYRCEQCEELYIDE